MTSAIAAFSGPSVYLRGTIPKGEIRLPRWEGGSPCQKLPDQMGAAELAGEERDHGADCRRGEQCDEAGLTDRPEQQLTLRPALGDADSFRISLQELTLDL